MHRFEEHVMKVGGTQRQSAVLAVIVSNTAFAWRVLRPFQHRA